MKNRAELLYIVILVPTAISVYDADTTMDCLESRRRCSTNASCRELLDKMIPYCGQSRHVCLPRSKHECHRTLTTLQTTLHFQQCVCPPYLADVDRCNRFQSYLFLHACVDNGAANTSVDWSAPDHVLRPAIDNFDEYDDADDIDDDDDDDDDAESMEEGGAISKKPSSCIGERKVCLQDVECNSLLDQYRVYCRESKKQNICLASQAAGCFNAITDLTAKWPRLFNCTCDMKREDTKQKCEHIQSRIANNTCLEWIPHFVQSTRLRDPNLDDLVSQIGDQPVIDGTCPRAVETCYKNSHCRRHLHDYWQACAWDSETISCNKEQCLFAIKQFYLFGRSEFTQAFIFCHCNGDDEESLCYKAKRLVTPKCAVVHPYPLACHQVIEQCESNEDCRARLFNYEVRCAPGIHPQFCAQGVESCRSALVQMMGSLLMPNCTCDHTGPLEIETCRQSWERLHNMDKCKGYAARAYEIYAPVTPSGTEQQSDATDTQDYTISYNDCKSGLTKDFPSYFPQPNVVRMYNNGSECSHVCYCLRNGSKECKELACPPPYQCYHDSQVYSHGASFEIGRRGPCRCIKSEIVCAVPDIEWTQVDGLFLHIGLSITDRNLVESSSPLKFDPAEVTSKLATLLNEDTAAQFCSLTLHWKHDTHLIFMVDVSKHVGGTSISSPGRYQRCTKPALVLSKKINRRVYSIIADAELSIIKAAKLGGVQILSPVRRQMPTSTPLHSQAAFGHAGQGVMSKSGCLSFLPLLAFISRINASFDSMWNAR